VDLAENLDFLEYVERSAYGYENNKDIPINKIDAINIVKFRGLKERRVELGKTLTIISGKNGTMKTTIMGLIAHPFANNNRDVFNTSLKTRLSEVFNLSKVYDDEYKYDILLTTDKNEKIKETVEINKIGDRHRIVVSGHSRGDGNFSFTASFLNLGRLNPIVETQAREKNDIKLTDKEKDELNKFYANILVSSHYGDFTAVSDDKRKKTFGPSGKDAIYDFSSISSGEDNLGSIFNKLAAFERANVPGLLCIDEIEASLHPSAQINIILYLLKWAQKHNVQIVLTTHSLHIIQYLYLNKKNEMDSGDIVINFISFSMSPDTKNYNIITNPDYSLAYKELTLSNPSDVSQKYKATVYCEDEMAEHMIKHLLGQKICRLVNFEHNLDGDSVNTGTRKNLLISLCRNFPIILQKTNTFLVLDADIKQSDVNGIPNKDLYTILPDADGFAIERRILVHLLSLPPNDDFFAKIDILQDAIKNDLQQNCRIVPAEVDNIKDVRKVDITSCKRWAKNNKKIFKQCITQYCKSISKEVKDNFKTEFLHCLNVANSRLGLPKMDSI